MPPAPVIRLAAAHDLPAINDIYNHYVHHSTCTYQTEPSTPDERAEWFDAHGPSHPVTVTEVDGVIIGWASISRFRSRAAYDRTVENAVYVRHDHHRRGVGSALLADSLERARAAGHHTVIAVIDAEQTGSVALHLRQGFVESGRLREAGLKFGRWLDVVYLQRML
jgi:phosphinothricin acetyltransferase